MPHRNTNSKKCSLRHTCISQINSPTRIDLAMMHNHYIANIPKFNLDLKHDLSKIRNHYNKYQKFNSAFRHDLVMMQNHCSI